MDFGTQTSDATGTLTFRGWFLPAEGYLLTPVTVPDGYTPEAADAFGIVTTARESADRVPAAVSRTVTTGLAAGSPPPTTDGGVAAATTTASGPAATTATPAPQGAALATTGTPVGTMALLGGGLVVLGAGALGTSTALRRRARQHG